MNINLNIEHKYKFKSTISIAIIMRYNLYVNKKYPICRLKNISHIIMHLTTLVKQTNFSA